MKKILTGLTLLFLLTSFNLYSECVLVPLSLKERVDASTLIVEGVVSSKNAQWNAGKTMISTINTINIAKIYKGAQLVNGNSVDLITRGGQVGNQAIKVDPELELELGSVGIFMLVRKNGEWVSESGPQGFIAIDKHTGIANDVFNTYPAFTIQGNLIGLIGHSPVSVNPSLTTITISSKRAAPTITSISPKTLTAGTNSILTIKGTNFNALRDTSSVQFKNADNGGKSYLKALKKDYTQWTDTMIKLVVRSTAGTGKIRIVTEDGVATSADTLKVLYNLLNVVMGDTIGFETREIGMNTSNGITWKMNQKFFDSAGARGAFIRSLERWRCGTYINWDTLGHVNHSNISLDGVNMCAWDTSSAMASGVLAQCFSFWAGCVIGQDFKWFVNELDIRFRVKPTGSTNWIYTTANANPNQFHFESVATHELGHGHQLGHIVDSTLVMHYAIGNGQTKPNLASDELSAGNNVMNKSTTSVCGKTAHSKLNSGNCAIVTPSPNFKHSGLPCKSQVITFTDSSVGNISAYSWNFGTDASPATANTKGPHNVTYSSGGSKTITLTITTLNGTLNKNKNLSVSADAIVAPDFSILAAEKGKVSFTNNSNNPTNVKWYFGDGDSSTSNAPTHQYGSGGTYSVKLKASNGCNSDEVTKSIKFAYLNFGANPGSSCIEQSVVYSDSSDNNVSSWQWSFPGGFPSTANGKGPHKITYPTSGLKSATLTIGVSGSSNQVYAQSNIINVSADTLTYASFIYGYYGKNIVGFDNRSHGSGMSYKWYFGDGDSSSEKNPIHTYTSANNKTVRLVVTGNCGTDDTTITLPDFTSVRHVSMQVCSIKPNPAQDQVVIEKPVWLNASYSIIDMNGRQILSGEVLNNQAIRLEDFESGIYTLTIRSDLGLQHIRLVINH